MLYGTGQGRQKRRFVGGAVHIDIDSSVVTMLHSVRGFFRFAQQPIVKRAIEKRGGIWFPDFDVRCQLRHALQKYVPVGHVRSRSMHLPAMARIAEMAVQRLV